jgi:hypothetical protein
VLRMSAVSVPAIVWRRTALACVIACAVGTVGTAGTSGAAGDQSTTPDPQELWRVYPLEQTPTGGGGTPARPPISRPSSSAPSSILEAPRTGPSWIALAAVAAGGAVFVLLALAFRRSLVSVPRGVRTRGNAETAARSRPHQQPPAVAAAPVTAGRRPPRVEHQGELDARRPPARAQSPRGAPAQPADLSHGALPQEGDRTSVAGRAASPPPPAAAPGAQAGRAPGDDLLDVTALPGCRFERSADAAEREKGRTGARQGPVCQIRWGRRGSRFYAVTVDADGIEHKFARSPRFEWRGPSPPEQIPEAQAALRQLAKQLRNRGWRPLRAKGKDFNEQQWYARRFRWAVTEAEDDNNARGSEGILKIEIVNEPAGGHRGSRAQP